MDIVNFGLNTVDVDSSQLIDLINNPVVILNSQEGSILLPTELFALIFQVQQTTLAYQVI